MSTPKESDMARTSAAETNPTKTVPHSTRISAAFESTPLLGEGVIPQYQVGRVERSLVYRSAPNLMQGFNPESPEVDQGDGHVTESEPAETDLKSTKSVISTISVLFIGISFLYFF